MKNLVIFVVSYGNHLFYIIIVCPHSGTKSTTMNVHMLQHLPECARRWGPLWTHSCFHLKA